MRADMFKVLVGRPRWGSRHIPSVKLKKDRNPYTHIGLKRHAWLQAHITKDFNENLAPLVRLLGRRVGRRWDDVFSEICARLDTGSTVKMHVRQHIGDFVVIGIVRGRYGELLHEGHVIRPDRGMGRYRPYYVDPKDGLLKDRLWFWRDRGQAVPHGRRDPRWGDIR